MDEAQRAWIAAVEAVQQLKARILDASRAQQKLSPAQRPHGRPYGLQALRDRIGVGHCVDVAACAAVLGMTRRGAAEGKEWLAWALEKRDVQGR
jgi:hypothetical protein